MTISPSHYAFSSFRGRLGRLKTARSAVVQIDVFVGCKHITRPLQGRAITNEGNIGSSRTAQ